MKKISLFLFIQVSLVFSNLVKADEGMWLPLLIERLNYVDMQKMGLKLTSEEIYSANHSSLKDAIISINNGYCSGSLISGEGLMITNQHCGYSSIQANSSAEKDYLKNGFWALNSNEELKCDKFVVTFLVRIEDVTQKILNQLTNTMSEAERTAKIEEVSVKLEGEAVHGTFHTAQVKSFFEKNEFYLFVYETYKDVRLVGAPPESIAQFGEETDNWMWPRQCGDFAIFRIYTSPTGEPAEYSKKNIPYKSKHFIPISLKGVRKDDFAMVLGYDSGSDRFSTSYKIKMMKEQISDIILKVCEKKLNILKEDMSTSEEIKRKYSTKFHQSSNQCKYFVGQAQIMEYMKVYDKKKEIEDDFNKWVNADKSRENKYGNVLSDLSKLFEELKKKNLPRVYFNEAIMRGTEIISYANTYEELYKQLKLGADEDAITKITQSLSYTAKQYFKNYNLITDKKLFIALIKLFYENVPANQHPDVFVNVVQKRYKGDIAAFANDVYDKSIFCSKDKVLEFLAAPNYKKLEKDLVWITQISFYSKNQELLNLYNNAVSNLEPSKRFFVQGMMEMQKDKKFYPDANKTMRLSYGKVTDYMSTTKTCNYFSTLDEMMAKEQPDNSDFFIPEKLKQLYRTRDFDKYADNGTMRINFITNNDVRSGASGSPVINANGELVGLCFDINWEGTSGDFVFDTNLQRTINVDIRFVLFLMDKYAGAQSIINELTIVK